MIGSKFCQAQILASSWLTINGATKHFQWHRAYKVMNVSAVKGKYLPFTGFYDPPSLAIAASTHKAFSVLYLNSKSSPLAMTYFKAITLL